MEQRTFLDFTLSELSRVFLSERKARKLSPKTIYFYTEKLNGFLKWLGDKKICEITSQDIRDYFSFLEDTGHNSGGIHASYRVIKVFLRWVDWEFEPEWKNPIEKVKSPKLVVEPLPGINIETVKKLIDSCDTNFSIRDKTILLFLVDSGLRANEMLSLKVSDIDILTGRVKVFKGKGQKSRVVFLGSKARKALRLYLKKYQPKNHLWINEDNEPLAYSGLRQIVFRRSQKIGITSPGLHDFRRCYAVTLYRRGVDVITISKLMGHSSLEVLKRYLNISEDDLLNAARIGSPADLI